MGFYRGSIASLEVEHTHWIHVWYIYLHEWLISMVNVGKYISPMDPIWDIFAIFSTENFYRAPKRKGLSSKP